MHDREAVLSLWALVSAITISLCTASNAQTAKPLWDKIHESGQLVCGAIPANPIGSWKVDTGYEGYEINLCRQLAQDLSGAMNKPIELTFKETTWATVVLDLQSRKIDIWPGMSETVERKKAIDMAGPMYFIAQCAVNRAGLSGLKTWSQYNVPGIRLAAVAGTSDEKAARELAPKATLLSFRDTSAVILAIQAGHADAQITSILTCLDLLNKNPSVFGEVVIPTPVSSLPSSAGLPKDSGERFFSWLQAWSQASRVNGTTSRLFVDAMQKAGLDTSKLPDGFSF